MDVKEFLKYGMDELKVRLSLRGQTSEKEVVKKFFQDQGHNFGVIDYDEVMDLVHKAK
jgi:hypothetical protein